MRSLSFDLWVLVMATAQERPKPSPEIQALLDAAAQTAPPELAGDIILRPVDSEQIPSKDQRVELIDNEAAAAVLPLSHHLTHRTRLPEKLETVGDHIRRSRLTFTLLQRQVAQQLGVNEATITNWETNNG